MPIIVLNKAEVMIAAAIGEMRHSTAVQAGYYRQIGATPQDDIIAERNGIIGEIAFGKWADKFVDFSFDARRGGFDFRYEGKGIDVKTSRVEGRGLRIDAWKIGRHAYQDVDAFVLAEIMEAHKAEIVLDIHSGSKEQIEAMPGGKLVNLVGWIGVKEFLSLARKIDAGGGGREAYILKRDDLEPLILL